MTDKIKSFQLIDGINFPSTDEKAALDAANTPSGGNAFVTMNDISSLGTGNLSGTLTPGHLPVATGVSTLGNSDVTQADIDNLKLYYNPNSSFFFDKTSIIAAWAENAIPINTLTSSPSGSSTATITKIVTNATAVMTAFSFKNATDSLITELNKIQINAGLWIAKLWSYVSDNSAINNIIIPIFISSGISSIDTITTTGTGTSRQAFRINGDIIFDASDANSNQLLSGYIEISGGGIYQITGRTSITQATISVPSGFTNVSGRDFVKHKNILQITAPITNTSLKETTFFSTPKTSFSLMLTDSLTAMVFAQTTNLNPVTFTLLINGTSNYSNIETPPILSQKSTFTPSVCLGSSADQYENYVGKQLSVSTQYNMTFKIPNDATVIDDILLELTTASNILPLNLDLTSDYAIPPSLALNGDSQSSLGMNYNIFANTENKISIKSLFPQAQSGSMCGIGILSHTAVATYYCLGVTVLYH